MRNSGNKMKVNTSMINNMHVMAKNFTDHLKELVRRVHTLPDR